jgi:plastocyanin
MPILVSSGACRRAVLVAALLAAACGGNDGAGPNPNPNNPPPPQSSAGDVDIVEGASTQTTTAFSPNPKVVSLGGNPTVAIRWINGDITGGDYVAGTPTIHNIAPDNAGDFPPSGDLGGNETHSITLSAPGAYGYHCDIHPNMVGTITVNP